MNKNGESIKIELGDCLDLMKLQPDNSIDMILCDLPYGITNCAWDSSIPLSEMWEQYERIIKTNGAIVLFAAQPFASILVSSNLKLFKYEWIWEKTHSTGFLNAKKQPLRAHENILVFYKKQPIYNPQKSYGHVKKTSTRSGLGSDIYNAANKIQSYNSTERYPRTVQTFKSDKQSSSIHPTQKPVALCEYLIKTYTNNGDLVLDNCMGSGTTGIACINTERNFIGIEKDYLYFKAAKDRIENALKGKSGLHGLQQVVNLG